MITFLGPKAGDTGELMVLVVLWKTEELGAQCLRVEDTFLMANKEFALSLPIRR